MRKTTRGESETKGEERFLTRTEELRQSSFVQLLKVKAFKPCEVPWERQQAASPAHSGFYRHDNNSRALKNVNDF